MIKKKDIIYFYTKARLETEVVKNYIGWVWWILDPVLAVGVYFVVFKLILDRGSDDYIPFLFVGIITWRWFQNTLQKGCMSIYENRNLYNKIYLPKIIFPWIEINFNTIKFLIIFSLLLISYPFFGYRVTGYHLYLPVVLLSQFVFTLGITTFLASLTPFLPDANFLIKHLLRLSFYPSGVLFSLDRVPEKYRFLVDFNPMAQSIESMRNVVMYGKPPILEGLVLLVTLGLLGYTVGWFIIRKNDGQYAKLL